jgi:glutathione peroxidase
MPRWLLNLISAIAAFVAPPVYAGSGPQSGNAHDFEFRSIDGTPLHLKELAGRVVLVVNTASMCGFTPQYSGLETLFERFEAAGLTVLGIPSNDFGGQEPKSEPEIKTFCQGAFNVRFPMTEKQVVRGPDAHPFYRWASLALGAKAEPRWNFHKILIGRDGRAVAAFGSATDPQSREVIAAIERELSRPVPTPAPVN